MTFGNFGFPNPNARIYRKNLNIEVAFGFEFEILLFKYRMDFEHFFQRFAYQDFYHTAIAIY